MSWHNILRSVELWTVVESFSGRWPSSRWSYICPLPCAVTFSPWGEVASPVRGQWRELIQNEVRTASLHSKWGFLSFSSSCSFTLNLSWMQTSRRHFWAKVCISFDKLRSRASREVSKLTCKIQRSRYHSTHEMFVFAPPVSKWTCTWPRCLKRCSPFSRCMDAKPFLPYFASVIVSCLHLATKLSLMDLLVSWESLRACEI